jgi:hypothetical protein
MKTPKPPRTEAQIEASRNNGRKSKGPATPEGKARSSLNAVTHALTSAKWLTPTNEDPAGYTAMHDEYQREWQPSGPTERDLVRQMSHAQYTLIRLYYIEVGLLDLEMSRMAPELATVEPPPDPPLRQTHAFESLAKSNNGLSLLNRYMARAERLYHRALHTLLALRKANPFPEPPAPDSSQSSIRVDPCASAANPSESEQTTPSPGSGQDSTPVPPGESVAPLPDLAATSAPLVFEPDTVPPEVVAQLGPLNDVTQLANSPIPNSTRTV